MVFYGHFQGCADNRLVALKLPKIDGGGAVPLVDSAGALDEHPAFRIPLDSPAWRDEVRGRGDGRNAAVTKLPGKLSQSRPLGFAANPVGDPHPQLSLVADRLPRRDLLGCHDLFGSQP